MGFEITAEEVAQQDIPAGSYTCTIAVLTDKEGEKTKANVEHDKCSIKFEVVEGPNKGDSFWEDFTYACEVNPKWANYGRAQLHRLHQASRCPGVCSPETLTQGGDFGVEVTYKTNDAGYSNRNVKFYKVEQSTGDDW